MVYYSMALGDGSIEFRGCECGYIFLVFMERKLKKKDHCSCFWGVCDLQKIYWFTHPFTYSFKLLFCLLFCFHFFSVIWKIFWYSSCILEIQLTKSNTKFTLPRSRFPHPRPSFYNNPSSLVPSSHNIAQDASYPHNQHSHSTHGQQIKFPPLTCYDNFQIITVSSNSIALLCC